MQTATKSRTLNTLNDNALARKAMEAIVEIEEEAKEKKQAQVTNLQSARAAITARIVELQHQVSQIDHAMASIQGGPDQGEHRPRRNLDDARERVKQWLEEQKGHKCKAGDIIREFPELEGMVMSVFLKPLIENGAVRTDTSEGIRRTKYFV